MPAANKSRDLSPAHKAAMATGRTESRAVKAYLEALESNKPKRGRKRTEQSIKARLAKIDSEWGDAEPLKRLKLTQEKSDLGDELKSMSEKVDMAGLEKAFVAVAKSYSDRMKLSYATWRTNGVSAETLKRAGITR